MNHPRSIRIGISLVFVAAWLVACQPTTPPGPTTANVETEGKSSTTAAVDPPPPSFPCPASASWVSAPNAPAEIPGGGTDFCQFYQFSWQWFLQLLSPAPGGDGHRRFQIAGDFPILEGEVNSINQDSCDAEAPQFEFFIMRAKARADDKPFQIPKRTGQAGGGATIYDQSGDVVFYDVRFSRNLCSVSSIQSQPNFPGGTTELKTAWKILRASDNAASYFTMSADVDGVPGPETLGMVGFHVAIATTSHPEFVWATFEHRSNDPNCNASSGATSGWSFTSTACATPGNTCTFNSAQPSTSLTGTPTEICRMYRDGTAAGDNKADENFAVVDTLNDQVHGFLTALPASDPMAVLQNYMMVGAIWESDVTQPSSNLANQRGSLRLANTVMETTFQNVDLSGQGFASNCFGCHNYQVSASNTQGNLSHIFDNIAKGLCTARKDTPAGPLFNNDQAVAKCPSICSSYGHWNGNWKTTVPGKQSVCGCCQGPSL